ncbi:MAG: division/cell wall cluster transcriptional repressor MraZ [Clostridia bacterium]|nr:division/cell wall cluster transcriptional repressor MraZ [Clostridia bacterium]
MSFSSSYKHTIDAKKRLFIPSKFRQMLGETFYLYYDPSLPCIAVYGEEEWEKKSKVVEESGDADWQRFFFSNVVSVEPDKQGRITVKASFCEGAGLKKDVAVVGVGNRVEIWDADKYQKELEQLNASFKRFPSVIN